MIALQNVDQVSVIVQLKSPAHCADPDAMPIASQDVLIEMRFDHTKQKAIQSDPRMIFFLKIPFFSY